MRPTGTLTLLGYDLIQLSAQACAHKTFGAKQDSTHIVEKMRGMEAGNVKGTRLPMRAKLGLQPRKSLIGMRLLNKKLANRTGEGVIVGILMGPGKLVTMLFLSCKKQLRRCFLFKPPSAAGLFWACLVLGFGSSLLALVLAGRLSLGLLRGLTSRGVPLAPREGSKL